MAAQARANPIRSSDIGEAEAIGCQFMYPQRLEVLDRTSPLDLTVFMGRIGPIFIGDSHYGTDVRLTCGELETSYHVNLPLSGYLVSTHRSSTVIATRTRAAVYGPVGDTVLDRWSGDCRLLCIKIERVALEGHLEERDGFRTDTPIAFEPLMDLSGGAGRSWAEMIIMVNEQLRRSDSLVHQPLVAASLASGLLSGLLVAAGHPRREITDRLPGPCRSPVIAQAIEFMHRKATDPITTADVAAHCCVSVRSLQLGFKKHVGQPPQRVLRGIRLRRAHHDLKAADPYRDSVGSIANRWGFAHLGRFAAYHEAEYGESPSQTLRSSSG